MSRLHFDYVMTLAFSEPAAECHYTIKCLPKNTDIQKISDIKIRLIPEMEFQRGEDAFGNQTIYGRMLEKHDTFGFHISGIADTNLALGDCLKEGEYAGRYLYPFGLNKAGAGIQKYFEELQIDTGKSAYEIGVELMNRLYADFVYEKAVTNVNTTAEEAWQQKKGVCQDYAHILIALCHLAKIPARYVTGMMVGEGFSHAWVEILSDDVWYGLDPTNGCLATETYIKIGVGRDASDCMINKGIIKGGGMQTQTVTVKVTELDAAV